MWSIECLRNDVTNVDSKVNEKLRKLVWWENGDQVIDGKLIFNSDDMEHMDWLGDNKVRQLLAKNGAVGVVCFGSLEGDNANSFWGYSFGNGKCTQLVGQVVWQPET